MKALLLIISVCFSLNLVSQEYFNTRLNFNDPLMDDAALNTLEVSDGYVLSGGTGNYRRQLSMAKISFYGEIMWKKNWGDTISDWWNSNGHSFVKHFNSYYTIGSKNTWYESLRHSETMLIKYDNNFDTVWVSYYGKGLFPYDSSYIARSFIGTENGFAVVGTLNIYYDKRNNNTERSEELSNTSNINLLREGYIHEPYILITDSLGNVEYEYNYYSDSGYYFHGNDIIKTSDGGYAIGAYKHVIGNYGAAVGDPIVLKTDSIGNKEWELNLGGQYQDGSALLCLSDDGNIIAASRFDIDSGTFNRYRSRIQISKINNQGSIIWNKLLADKQWSTYVNNIRTDSLGGFVISGMVGNTNWPVEPSRMGYILRVNGEGDSLWYRKYSILNGKYSSNYFYDAIPTSDGGFLGAGVCRPAPPDTGNTDTWVIKIDSMGCTSITDCWVGKPEWKWVETENGNKIKVYPNPAHNWFEVEVEQGNEPHPDFSIELFDLYGRFTEEVKIPKGKTSFKFYVSNWNRGVYLVRVKSNKGILGSCKVILN